MRPLFRCRSCGFLSTLGSEFRTIERVIFCGHCADSYESERAPVRQWVCEALSKEAAHDRG